MLRIRRTLTFLPSRLQQPLRYSGQPGERIDRAVPIHVPSGVYRDGSYLPHSRNDLVARDVGLPAGI